MQLIYPSHGTRILIPRELNGEKSNTVFRAAHRSVSSNVYWYLDNQYVGSTKEFHTVELQPSPGKHTIILVDETGERVEREFEIVGLTP
jgi:penicillin-binding protein 1C